MKSWRLSENTYTAGATLAFWTVERLMFRACSLTRDFASIIEDPAFVERHRTKEDVMALFCAPWTRILAAGSDMVDYDRPPNQKRDREMEGGRGKDAKLSGALTRSFP